MILSKQILFHRLQALVASAIVLSMASVASAQVYLAIDGRDVANLAGDGNQNVFHNPPMNFAFTFGGIAADNPDTGPGDPYTDSDTNFNFTGNDFGGLGFGTASAGDLAFPAANAIFEMDVTVNAGNTLGSLILNLKDADTLSAVQVHLIEEHQYNLALGAPGTKTITALIASPSSTQTPRDGTPNFDIGNGLTELQLQYPFADGGTGAILDITIHGMRIREIPEPSTLLTAMLGMGLCSYGFRRNKDR